MKTYLDKLTTFGSIVAAAACPACFPQLAALGTVLGLGAFAGYEGQMFLVTKILVAIAIVGQVFAFFNHRVVWMLVLGVGGGLLFFLGMYLFGSEAVIYIGFLAMAGASIADAVRRARIRPRLKLLPNAKTNGRSVIEESEITCPKCGFTQLEKMPTDACQFFYECHGCKAVLRPSAGDCCVFCSFGSVKCPSVQTGLSGCCL